MCHLHIYVFDCASRKDVHKQIHRLTCSIGAAKDEVCEVRNIRRTIFRHKFKCFDCYQVAHANMGAAVAKELWLELHERDRDVQILKRDMLVLRLKVSQADKTLDSPISSHDANYDDNDEDEDFEYWEEEKEERRHLTEEELEAEYLLEEALEDERIMRERRTEKKAEHVSKVLDQGYKNTKQEEKDDPAIKALSIGYEKLKSPQRLLPASLPNKREETPEPEDQSFSSPSEPRRITIIVTPPDS